MSVDSFRSQGLINSFSHCWVESSGPATSTVTFGSGAPWHPATAVELNTCEDLASTAVADRRSVGAQVLAPSPAPGMGTRGPVWNDFAISQVVFLVRFFPCSKLTFFCDVHLFPLNGCSGELAR